MAGTGVDPHRLRLPRRGTTQRDLTSAHIESFNYAVSEGVYRAVQDVPPVEFALKDTRLALTLVGVSIAPPAVPAGTVCQERRVFPAECRGLRSTYRGRITESRF